MPMLSDFTNWQFLNEPLYRWFLFFGAILLISYGWNGILSYIPRG